MTVTIVDVFLVVAVVVMDVLVLMVFEWPSVYMLPRLQFGWLPLLLCHISLT